MGRAGLSPATARTDRADVRAWEAEAEAFPQVLASCGLSSEGDRDKNGEGQQELSHALHPLGQGRGRGQGGMSWVIPTGPHHPGVSWPCWGAALGPGGTPVTLTLSSSLVLALEEEYMDLDAEPSPICPCLCSCRAGARLSYRAQVHPCHHGGVGMRDAGTWPWSGESSLPAPSGADRHTALPQHDPQTPARHQTADSSMSPSPRCSAASLVNWESEMKHCSSGREELHTLGTSETPTRWNE